MKYSIEVTITAQCTYTVQVERGYLTGEECEVTQLTWQCDDCADECSEAEYSRTGGLCDKCDREFQLKYADTRSVA